MKNLNYYFFFLVFAFAISTSKSQTTTTLTQVQKNDLLTVWYQSPKESNGDTIVFRKEKYVLDYSVDDPAFAFALIKFTSSSHFEIEYWNWCHAAPSANSGSWNTDNMLIKLDFGQGKCKNDLEVLLLNENILKVIIKEN